MYSDARAYSYITAKRDYEFIYIALLLIYFNKNASSFFFLFFKKLFIYF